MLSSECWNADWTTRHVVIAVFVEKCPNAYAVTETDLDLCTAH